MERSTNTVIPEDFLSMSEVERTHFLGGNSDGQPEEKPYSYTFSEQEIAEIKSEYTAASLTIEEKNDEKSAYLDTLKEELKPLKENVKKLGSIIRKGYEDRKTMTYPIANHATGLMEYIDINGNVVTTRNLTPAERATLRLPLDFKRIASGE